MKHFPSPQTDVWISGSNRIVPSFPASHSWGYVQPAADPGRLVQYEGVMHAAFEVRVDWD